MHVTIIKCKDIIEKRQTLVLILEPVRIEEAERVLVLKEVLDKHNIEYGIYEMEDEVYFLSTFEESSLNNTSGLQTNSLIPLPDYHILGIPLNEISKTPLLNEQLLGGNVSMFKPKV